MIMISRSFGSLEMMIIGILVLVIAAVGLPSIVQARDSAKESAAMQSLHEIQVQVEKYKVDLGEYPGLLIGGDIYFQNRVEDDDTKDVEAIKDKTRLADPLLRTGYLSTYPRNPFVAVGSKTFELQRQSNDELRADRSPFSGCRFGGNGLIMGQILHDWRYFRWKVKGPGGEPLIMQLPTTPYKPYSTWNDFKKEHTFISPGNFMYKSSGTYPIPEALGGVSRPSQVTQYVLGVFGDIDQGGYDILGEEPSIRLPQPINGVFAFSTWMRSNGLNKNDRRGSPFGQPNKDEPNKLTYGSKDGFGDGLILVLTPGNDGREQTDKSFETKDTTEPEKITNNETQIPEKDKIEEKPKTNETIPKKDNTKEEPVKANVSGRIIYPSGVAVPKYAVKVFSNDSVVAETYTNEDGSFYLGLIKPGQYIVKILWDSKDDPWTYLERVISLTPQGLNLTIKSDELTYPK